VSLTDEEIEGWKSVATHLFIPKPDHDGVIEQFQGFRALKPVELKKSERYHAPVSRLLKWGEVNQLRLVKQADLLMIPFLFPEAFSAEVLAANYGYYDVITDHGSSLSPCVHAAIAARIGRFEDAKKYWERSLNLDLGNKMSNTALGIHAAAMGGTWQALAFHILGISLFNEGPHVTRSSVDPVLSFLGDIDFKLVYRGKTFSIHLEQLRRAAA
jgi:alpha,alpha-trehalose phosphorylase